MTTPVSQWSDDAFTTITRDQAIEVLAALKDGLVPRAKIHY